MMPTTPMTINSSNSIIKFAEDTVVIGLIMNSDEQSNLNQVDDSGRWCVANNLALNISKEMFLHFRRQQAGNYNPLKIYVTPVEKVVSFKYIGVHITEDLSWSLHISSTIRKAR